MMTIEELENLMDKKQLEVIQDLKKAISSLNWDDGKTEPHLLLSYKKAVKKEISSLKRKISFWENKKRVIQWLEKGGTIVEKEYIPLEIEQVELLD